MTRLGNIIIILLVIFLVSGVAYILHRLDFTQRQAHSLKTEKENLLIEKDQLQLNLNQVRNGNARQEATIAGLSKELAGLQDAKKTKQLFLENQEKLQKLDTEYSQTKKEKSLLEQTNLTLSNRLTNLTREFTKTLESVKELKQELNAVKGDKLVRSYMSKLEKTEEILKKRGEEIKSLKEENKNLSAQNIKFDKENKDLEKKVARLEKDKEKLTDQVEKIRLDFNEQQRTHAGLKEDVKKLKAELKEKENLKLKLDMQVEQLSEHKKQLSQKLDNQNEKINQLENELLNIEKKSMQIKKTEKEKNGLEEKLQEAQEKLEEQKRIIARLEGAKTDISLNEIPSMQSGTSAELQDNLNKAYALYDTAKAQVVKFSELLMSKEVEIETSKQKISKLEAELQLLKAQPGGLADPSGNKQYAMLRDRIMMLNEALSEKDSALRRKDEENSALTLAKATLEERLNYQEKEYKNANALYANLKSQLLQTTELLTRSEFEVTEQNKEILELKNNLAILQAEYKSKERELKSVQQQQRKTMEDLSEATSLNFSLQEDVQRRSQRGTADTDEKRKADDLKKEIEALLGR